VTLSPGRVDVGSPEDRDRAAERLDGGRVAESAGSDDDADETVVGSESPPRQANRAERLGVVYRVAAHRAPTTEAVARTPRPHEPTAKNEWGGALSSWSLHAVKQR